MPLRSNMEFQEYLGLFLRRKWIILFSFLVVMFGASVYCVVSPEKYVSSTTILVIPQRVPENYVRSTVSTRIEERLSTIQQEVMSRTRLGMVIEEFRLFPNSKGKAAPEELIENMRKRIGIQVRGNDAFTLSFTYEDPKIAMLTASRLASFFIDENLKKREQQAVGTSEFLESQLNETKGKLEVQEERVRKYKVHFMGELPQQMEANLALLRRLQDQYKANADGVRMAEDRKSFLEARLGILESTGVSAVPGDDGKGAAPGTIGQDPAAALVAELSGKKASLQEAGNLYTERHPEVLRIRREIENLEQRIAAARKNSSASVSGAESKGGPRGKVTARSFAASDEMEKLRSQISIAEMEISAAKSEMKDIQRNINAVQSKVEQAPRREQEMIGLTRDYDNLKRSYDDLVRKKLDADISQNLEKRQKGEQFQIIDPANLPVVPFTPDRKKIMGVAFFLSFAIAFGGVIGFEMIDTTLRGTKDFRHFFALPILASIPVIMDAEYSRRKKLRFAVVIGGIVSFLASVTIFLFLYGNKVKQIIQY